MAQGPRSRRIGRVAALSAAVLTAIGTVSACSSGAGYPKAADVAASTEVWASVARAVTGDHLSVRAIMTGADADPHSFQATPSDAAALLDARLVVYNGGGYDSWVDSVLDGRRNVRAVAAYQFRHGSNEHVFYDLDVAKSVASAVAEQLSTIDPAEAATYRGNAATFSRDADGIADAEHAIATSHPAAGVIATEPVVYYLLRATGLTDRTPPAFSEAGENDTEPAPADMATVLDLVEHRDVAAVLVNPQTSTAAITRVLETAKRAGVPIVEVSETMPDATDYLSWQRNTVERLTTALGSAR